MVWSTFYVPTDHRKNTLSARIEKDDQILEIGPGRCLTEGLLKLNQTYKAFEIDHDKIHSKHRYPDIDVHQGDASRGTGIQPLTAIGVSTATMSALIDQHA